jgi:hypothetical protein
VAVVRYLTLAALVVWLGGTVYALGADLFRRPELVAYGCGAAMLIGLLIMKFVGPPPRGFRIRAALVVAMLATAAVASVRGGTRSIAVLDLALGLTLLGWYVHE